MITKTVTARIPAEVKKQGDARLRKMGMSPSKFIRLAYERLINDDAMSGAQRGASGSGGGSVSGAEGNTVIESEIELDVLVRDPNEDAKLMSMLQETSLAEPLDMGDFEYKRCIREAKLADYERLV